MDATHRWIRRRCNTARGCAGHLLFRRRHAEGTPLAAAVRRFVDLRRLESGRRPSIGRSTQRAPAGRARVRRDPCHFSFDTARAGSGTGFLGIELAEIRSARTDRGSAAGRDACGRSSSFAVPVSLVPAGTVCVRLDRGRVRIATIPRDRSSVPAARLSGWRRALPDRAPSWRTRPQRLSRRISTLGLVRGYRHGDLRIAQGVGWRWFVHRRSSSDGNDPEADRGLRSSDS